MLFRADKITSSLSQTVFRKPFPCHLHFHRNGFQTKGWRRKNVKCCDDTISARSISTSRFGTLIESVQEHQLSKNLKAFPSAEQQMSKLLADGMRNTSTDDYDEFVSKSMKRLSVSKLSNFVRLSGKKSANKTFFHLKRNLPAVSQQIESISKSKWCWKDVAFLTYGLQCLEETDDGYLSIMASVNRIIKKNGSSGGSLAAQDIGMMFVGIQNNHCRHYESKQFLLTLADIIRNCFEKFSSQNIGNALYGLKKMTTESHEVRVLLSALATKVVNCTESLRGQEIGNALYGLQGMSSDSQELLQLVAALTPKVHDSSELMKAQEVSNALFGLQGMGSDSREVQLLLSALALRIQSCKDDFNAQCVGNSLYGLQGMSSECREVQVLLSALAPRIQSCDDLNAQCVGNSLYGLQGMNSDCDEVQLLLSALAPKVVNCKQSLTATEVGNALYGLQNFCSLASSLDILRYLSAQIRRNIRLESLEMKDLISFGQSIALSLRLLSIHAEVAEEVLALDALGVNIVERINEVSVEDINKSTPRSSAEMRVLNACQKTFKRSNVLVSNNERLVSLFEGDIVLRTLAPGSEVDGDQDMCIVINIEVDGLRHRRVNKRRFDRLRDAHLQSKGITVRRIESSAVSAMNESQLEQCMQGLVADALADYLSTAHQHPR